MKLLVMKSRTLLISTSLALGFLVSDVMAGGLLLAPRAIAQPKPYPPEAVESFMYRCTRDGTVPRSYCACTIRELQRTMSFVDLMTYALEYYKNPNTPIPKALFNAVETCQSQHQQATEKSEISFSDLSSPPAPYPKEVVQGFIQGCKENGKASQKFCQCSIDELQKRLSFDEFMQWSWQLQEEASAPTPFAVNESTLFCSIEHNLSQI
jgi:hypothetical protein